MSADSFGLQGANGVMGKHGGMKDGERKDGVFHTQQAMAGRRAPQVGEWERTGSLGYLEEGRLRLR